MKLVAKAKPVKIRIKSGGEEHSSLDSLKHDFNIEDIKPLLDGRLSRWLRQQGKTELSEIVSEFNPDSLNTPEGIMGFMNVLFKDYIASNSITNLYGLIVYWLNTSEYKVNGANLFRYVIWDLANSIETFKLIKDLYKNRNELKCPETDWYLAFYVVRTEEDGNGKTKCEDPEILFILGNILLDGYYSFGDPKGLELIEESARLGCQDAVLFFRDGYDKKYESGFSGIDKGKIKCWIKEIWGWNNETRSYNFNKKEKLVVDFVHNCKVIWSDAVTVSLNSAFYTFDHIFVGADCANLFSTEIIFLRGLLYYNKGLNSSAIKEFMKIDKYPLAKYMLSNDKCFGEVFFKRMSFSNQLEFVVKHLFDYE